eukprot:m.125949 g.125949  ORF g.125949 m.125949 type:complete len:336 (+) comp14505_c1_seq7:94-1101(+)
MPNLLLTCFVFVINIIILSEARSKFDISKFTIGTITLANEHRFHHNVSSPVCPKISTDAEGSLKLGVVVGMHKSHFYGAIRLSQWLCLQQTVPADYVYIVCGELNEHEAKRFAEAFGACPGELIWSPDKLGAHDTRNIGAAHVPDDYLRSFIDADDLPHPQWLDYARIMFYNTNYLMIAHGWHPLSCDNFQTRWPYIGHIANAPKVPGREAQMQHPECITREDMRDAELSIVSSQVGGGMHQFAFPHITVADWGEIWYRSAWNAEDSVFVREYIHDKEMHAGSDGVGERQYFAVKDATRWNGTWEELRNAGRYALYIRLKMSIKCMGHSTHKAGG